MQIPTEYGPASWAHQYRRLEVNGDYMQVDETFFSKIKVGGPNRNRRVRQADSEVAQTLCDTTRGGKLREIYVTPVPDKKGSTLVPLVEELAREPRTRIWTDGATHNAPGFDGKYLWSEVIHRNEWIIEGVHTNIVEGANSMLKKRLMCEWGSLGRSSLQERHDSEP